MIITTNLLFTTTGTFLGEVRLQSGAYDQATLTADGDRALGAAIREWQTQGIMHEGRHVQPRDTAFGQALQAWCGAKSLVLVPLPSPLHLECWQMLLRIPVMPTDRLAMLQAIVNANADAFVAWQQFLSEALAIVTTETHKTDAALYKLQQKAAESLVKRFAHS